MSNKRGHNSPDFKRLLDRVRSRGFTVVEKGKSVIVTPPDEIRNRLPDNLKQYIAHIGEKALHPVRRYVKNQCGVSDFA